MIDKVIVRCDKRTQEQDELCTATYAAAKVLREAGIPCTVREWFCTDPSESPASIDLTPKGTETRVD